MSPSLTLLILVDVLHEAGIIDDIGSQKARNYLHKIPKYLKATPEEYEKWRNGQ